MATLPDFTSCSHWNCAHHDNDNEVCGLGGCEVTCPIIINGEVASDHDEQHFFASDDAERASIVRTANALLHG